MKDAHPLPAEGSGRPRPARNPGPAQPCSGPGCADSLRSPVGWGGYLREQLLLYVLGEKLQLKVGQGNFPGVLPLLKILFRHFLVICFRRSKRMGCWL